MIITGILPTVGKISDLRGRKGIFILGLAIFTIGSILSAISATIGQLIAYRVIQGIGGAIMQANVMSIIAYTFPPGSRGKAMGLIGSVVAYLGMEKSDYPYLYNRIDHQLDRFYYTGVFGRGSTDRAYII
ncbi:MFS transporter [Tepidibacillus infernus]|uniref:MFS transporter n=1 Tax=Tepidibacillus TaxID=1494427 RepID=UPI0009E6A5A3|nr:MFS transporter [Tepidibacillus decaturensis]